MPLLDMPLAELLQYQGRNPRPSDHDAFWNAALSELDRCPLEYKSTPAPFALRGAEFDSIWFEGVGGARIHARRARPTWCGAPWPTVLYFHGYTGRAPDWFGLAPWIAAGNQVWALDCRGQAGLSEDPGGHKGNTLRGHIIRGLQDHPEKLYYRSVFLDVAQMARLALADPTTDRSKVYSYGASQGGALSLVCAALEPRVSKCASMYPFLSDYKRVWEMDMAKDAYHELRDYLRFFDPRHEKEEEIFTKLGYIDIQFLAPRIRAEVKMVTALMDSITPPSTQFAAYNKIQSPKSFVCYPDYGHEGLPDSNDLILEFFDRTAENGS